RRVPGGRLRRRGGPHHGRHEHALRRGGQRRGPRADRGGGMSRRIQVIGAHSADFVWRAGGAIAKAVEAGGTAEVVALTYGERGESGELWKEEGQTVENVKRLRHAEAEAAANALGAPFRCLDLGDYPLQIDADALAEIADVIRAFAPHVLVTHTDT